MVAVRRDGTTVFAIVLAAGSSARMGGNKLLLDWNGESLVRRAARAAVAADRVLAVLGHEAERVRAELSGLPVEIVLNADHARGMGTSLRAGVHHAAAEGAGAVVIVLGDMPLVGPQTVAAVIDRYRRTRAPLVVSRYGGVAAPPTLYDRALFGDLLTVADDRGGRMVADRHRDRSEVVDWPAEALADLDTPAEYEAARAGALKDPGRKRGGA